MSKFVMGLIAAALLVLGTILYFTIIRDQTLLATESPHRTSKIIVRYGPADFFGVISPKTVSFVHYRQGSDVAKSHILTTENWSDARFLDQFPNHRWLGENVLQFTNQSEPRGEYPDIVRVFNQSSRKINYLVIGALGIYVVIDLEAGSSIELKAPRYKWHSWITVQGTFDNGHLINPKGVNFFHKDRIPGPLEYLIKITDDETEISGPGEVGSIEETGRSTAEPLTKMVR